MIIIIMFFRYW